MNVTEAPMWRPTVRQMLRGSLELLLETLALPFRRKRVIRYRSAGQSIRGAIYYSESTPAAGVLLLPTALGLTPHEHAMAARLASAGFTTLVIGYSGRTTGAILRDEAQRRRLEQVVLDAFDILQSDSKVDEARTGLVGLSLGGYFATQVATSTTKAAPGAVVVFYGMYAALEPALANLRAPLLILQGDGDSAGFVASAQRARERALGHDKVCELVIYGRAGHQFDLFEPRSEATLDAWDRMVAFLRQHLS